MTGTQINTHQLTLSVENIDAILLRLGKRILSVEEVIYTELEGDIQQSNKFYYYGKMYSGDGVICKLHTHQVGYFDTREQREIFFDELTNGSLPYQFIGYKILTNS